jgi:hypothetical protein
MRTIKPAGLALILLSTISGCSSTKAYRNEGAPNLKVIFKSGGAFLARTDLAVSVFEYLPSCKVRYLGTIEISRNENGSLSLPVNRALGVKTIFKRGGFFSNTEYTNSSTPFRQVFKKGEQYELEVEEDNGAIGRNFYRTDGGKRTDLEALEFYPSKCKIFEDE